MSKKKFNFVLKFLLIILLFSSKSSANSSHKVPNLDEDQNVEPKNYLSNDHENQFSFNGTSNVSN